MVKRKITQYNIEFKKSSAQLACQSDQSVAQTAKELGVNLGTLNGWIKKYGSAAGAGNELSLAEELKQLRKENIRLKLERDILKKAAAYFANDQL
jgi:transposase